MSTDWLLDRMAVHGDRLALVWHEQEWSHGRLATLVRSAVEEVRARGIRTGDVVGLIGDVSPRSCAMMMALAMERCIVVPFASVTDGNRQRFLDLALVTRLITIGDHNTDEYQEFDGRASHPLYDELRRCDAAGLILFSSGSTGESKGAVLDFSSLLEGMKKNRRSYRTLMFLLLDHIGGINTLFNILASGGALIVPHDRSPEVVAKAIARYEVELLPTTPTFINMLLIANVEKRHSLSSLRLVTYGTEPMPHTTLRDAVARLPHARFKQTYGLSELGILPTRSEKDDSLWIEVGGADARYEVRGGILWIHSTSSMLGYLNAQAPFDPEGWFNTGDAVEVKREDGKEYLRILGRVSELINVGGQKVYPAEVESCLRTLSNVRDVTVFGKRNAVTGHVVAVRVSLLEPEEIGALRVRMRVHAARSLEPFKIPISIEIAEGHLHSSRFKKERKQLSA